MARGQPFPAVTMKRVMRLLDIIERLEERPRSTEELAQECGVSERTIRRDLADIQGEPKYAALVRRVLWGFIEE